jgi:hypothetical protein
MVCNANPSPASSEEPPLRCGEGIKPDPELVRFAVIGDYGTGESPCAAQVAQLVAQWEKQSPLDLIMSLGDNNYEHGAASTLRKNVLRYYGDYIKRKVFFPSLGNHDWETVRPAKHYKYGRPYPYLNQFSYLAKHSPKSTPPVEGRYYQVAIKNRVELFALDSNFQEPDGTCCDSKQARWLKSALGRSTVPWKLVYFHHPPFSTAKVDFPGVWMRWPFKQWCASAVLSGHEHVYERLEFDGLPYFINGLGGNPWTYMLESCPVEAGSIVRYNATPGAMLVVANSQQIEFCFYSTANPNHPVDKYRMVGKPQSCSPPPEDSTPPPEQVEYCRLQPPSKRPVEPACPANNFPAHP